jgi:hypothetical protein
MLSLYIAHQGVLSERSLVLQHKYASAGAVQLTLWYMFTSRPATLCYSQIDTASELLFLQAASTAQAENLNCMRIFNVDSDEVQQLNFNFNFNLVLNMQYLHIFVLQNVSKSAAVCTMS